MIERVLRMIIALKRIIEVLDVCHNIYVQVCTVLLRAKNGLELLIEELVGPALITAVVLDLDLTKLLGGHHDILRLAHVQEPAQKVPIEISHLAVVI